MAKAITDPVSPELRQILRTLKLGKLMDTLPERLTLAKQQQLPHAEFLELVLADEVTRRETNSATLRARAAGLDAGMRLETWDTTAAVRFDQQLWNELTSLRFLDGSHGALSLGPVGVGKTHLATALGTSPSDGATACTWPAPTSCSNGWPPPAWTTPSRPRSAGWLTCSC
jgi:DNA replication protein DnaC